MRVSLPGRAYLNDIERFLRLIEDDGQDDLTFVMRDSLFSVHPLVVCILAALGAETRTHGANTELVNPKGHSSARYLQRIGLLDSLQVDSGVTVQEHEPAGRFVPLRQVATNDELNEFILEVGPLLHADPETTKSVKYALFELIRNVLEHSGSSDGAFVCAQVTKNGRLMLGVADAGNGVQASMVRSHPVATDRAAIELAFEPGVSGTTTSFGGNESNGGAGLFFTKAMAVLSGTHMVMISGDTLMKLLTIPGKRVNRKLSEDRVTWKNVDQPYPGTAVGIDLRVADEQGFEDLFKGIRQAYNLNIRQTKNARYKARFKK